MNNSPLRQYGDHRRDWRDNLYVYPVISRRSQGLSIGINLSPSAVCNFNCVYCQVDRSRRRPTSKVDLAGLRAELAEMIAEVQSGRLWQDPLFSDVPRKKQHINDLAFSGDGEPTASPCFREGVELAVELKREAGLDDTKIVLITNASQLRKPEVEAALAVMDENNGQVWAKLDAGTAGHFQAVNRTNVPLQQVVDNIIAVARLRPIVIQSLFMRIAGQPPYEVELAAYTDRLREIVDAGGKIDYVQVYTVARRPAEEDVEPLTPAELDRITELVRQTGIPAEAFYGSES
ncbi:MAG: radical SAM protein [Planctomycetes bacterium]|nr:radical SAM protein [Planctomycetota bacterium]